MTEDTENRVDTNAGEPEKEQSADETSKKGNNTANKDIGSEDTHEAGPAEDSKNENADETSGADSAEASEKAENDKTTDEASEDKKNNDGSGKDKTDAVKEENGKLKKDLENVNSQLKKQKDMFLRTVAEYDNYRKRTEREKNAVYSDATAAAVKEILTVEDNLSRALNQKNCSAEDLRKGVEMVEKQMRKALKKLGVTEMGKEGETFDPTLHSAVSHVDDENAGENTVVEVFQKGYMIGGKVIRHAMVKVAN